MLFGALILVSTILATNGYPSTPPSSDVVLQNSAQQELIYQTAGDQQLVFQSPEQEQYVYQTGQESFNDDYFSHIDSQSAFVEQGADFTISCVGENKICTSKNDCVNGYVHVANNVAYSLSGKVQQCKVQTEVCCTIAELRGANTKTHIPEQDLRGDTNNIGLKFDRPFITVGQGGENRGTVNLQPADDIAVQNAFAAAIPVQVGCAAALICVEEKFCTADGTISPEPVTFSAKQLFQRVPLSTCKNPDNGILGKCCRDPNYVDPWPTGNLPANYSGGFDEQGFPTFLNIAKVKPVVPTKVGTKSPPRPQIHPPVQQRPEPILLPENSVVSSEVLLPPIEIIPDENQENKFTIGQATQICGVRNKVPQKHEESETAFAEIPWQAMVLHTNEKKILCSGALVSAYDVLTAANCVDRMLPNDVSIKLGEWKLGYELKHEEPLPYQIINVSYINVHPGYVKGHGDHDLAMLHLQQPAAFNYHINPLCMPTRSPLQPNRPCITTGWGKSILQAHYAGAIMHAVNLDVLSSERCKEQVAHTDLNVNSVDGTICAATKEQRNNVCETDIGGPLACENENGVYELAGIYSQDTGCLPTNQVAIFAPLDNIWIKETMLKSTPSNSITFTNQRESSTEYPGSLLVNDYRQSTLSTDNQYLLNYCIRYCQQNMLCNYFLN